MEQTQLEQLMKEANPLSSYASDLQSAITQVALVCDQDDDDNNIFPGKKEIIETMANAVDKMQRVSKLLSDVCPEKMAQDAAVFFGVSETQTNIQECINKLGEVLNELVIKESLDDPSTLEWMSNYVVETRMYLAALKFNFTPVFVKEKS